MPRAMKFRSGRMNSEPKAETAPLSSSSAGWATPATGSSGAAARARAGAGAVASGRPSRAASTPAMYSSSSVSACMCATGPITPVSQNETSAAICIAGATEK